MNYSIRYLNERGITKRSEFLSFQADAAAAVHAEADGKRYFSVEIWKVRASSRDLSVEGAGRHDEAVGLAAGALRDDRS